MGAEARLAELGITLPAPGKPLGTYVPVRIVGDWAWVSGQGPQRPDGSGAVIGQVPGERTVEEAVEAARFCGLQALAQLRAALGSLDRVECVVQTLGMVNAAPDFGEQPRVINGFADLMVEVFGEEAGKGARSAVGMGSLPNGITVEVEMSVKLRSA